MWLQFLIIYLVLINVTSQGDLSRSFDWNKIALCLMLPLSYLLFKDCLSCWNVSPTKAGRGPQAHTAHLCWLHKGFLPRPPRPPSGSCGPSPRLRLTKGNAACTSVHSCPWQEHAQHTQCPKGRDHNCVFPIIIPVSNTESGTRKMLNNYLANWTLILEILTLERPNYKNSLSMNFPNLFPTSLSFYSFKTHTHKHTHVIFTQCKLFVPNLSSKIICLY